MFKRKGGRGGQRPFEQCSKKLHFSYGTASLMKKVGKVEMMDKVDEVDNVDKVDKDKVDKDKVDKDKVNNDKVEFQVPSRGPF